MAVFALHDYDDKLKAKGAIDITKYIHDLKRMDDVAERGNKKGYGIFWVVNDFEGARKKENLKKINFWYCDIDGGDKVVQMKKINKLRIPPSFVIETKNGYHCYWGVEGEATLENFEKIEIAICEMLDGDIHCKDVLRLLRCPGYYHMKNPKEPFMVHIVDGVGTDKAYTEKMMMSYFVREQEEQKKNIKHIERTTENVNFMDEGKWDDLFGLSTGIPKTYKNGSIIYDKNGKVVYKKSLSLIGTGNRNSNLARIALWLRDEHLPNQDIAYIVRTINSKYVTPSLSDREVTQILRTKGVME